MGVTDLVSPIALTDGDNAHLGHHEGALDGTLHFLVALPAETNVLVAVTDNNVGFEAGPLTGLGLFLDRLDLHDFVLKVGDEVFNNLELLDGDGELEDVVDAGDPPGLDQTTELGDWFPGLLVALSTTASGSALAVLALAVFAARAAWATGSRAGATGAVLSEASVLGFGVGWLVSSFGWCWCGCGHNN